MSELSKNILDFEGFRLKKQFSLASSKAPSFSSNSAQICPKELDIRINNIKQSIQRINKLMAELKTISDDSNRS